jgi:hypothetical protein
MDTEQSHETNTKASSRIAALARVAGTGLSAVILCSPMFLAARPKTPLRVFCIAAFEHFARLQRATLGSRCRQAMAYACDFGSLRNDYYDHGTLNMTEYRLLRRQLRRMAPEGATARYIQELRHAERNRPTLQPNTPGLIDTVITYRTCVLDITLRWLHAISGLSVESARLHPLLAFAGLAQLADDLLDWKDDITFQLPSHVTALLFHGPASPVRKPLRAHADALLRRTVEAARQDAGVLPLAVASLVTWAFIVALLRVRFPQ